ncbi:hypothetical protein AL523_01775 [Enterococcus gallinarum]|nr:hypothetical protein AL523_01775 [Enterococcus gallinarum]
MTDRIIKLRIRDSKGDVQEYFQDFVPYSKRLDFIRKERELESRTDDEGKPITTTLDEYLELQAEFVAGLFDDKRVTKKAIMDGVDTTDDTLSEIIKYRVLRHTKPDEQVKKILEKSGGGNTTN